MTGVARLIAGDQMTSAVAVDASAAMSERELDDILADSFPASDAPPWTLGVAMDASRRAVRPEARANDRRRGSGDASAQLPRRAHG
jgi:hypothetical protein